MKTARDAMSRALLFSLLYSLRCRRPYLYRVAVRMEREAQYFARIRQRFGAVRDVVNNDYAAIGFQNHAADKPFEPHCKSRHVFARRAKLRFLFIA